MKTTFFLRFVAMMFLILGTAQAEAPREYRVGVILPLSGQVSSLGTYVKKGIDLAYERLPQDRQAQLKLIFEDDSFEPTKTLTAYRKLRSAQDIDAVFVLGSPTANALVPITEREKKILIAIGASDSSIAVGRNYSFIHWVIPPVLGEALADEVQRRRFQRVAFVAAEATGTLADMNAALSAMKARDLGENIVFQETFAASEMDYRAALTQIRTKKPDLVVAVFFPGALSSFAKQFRASKIPAELAGMETFEDEGEVRAAEGALNNTWYVNAADPLSDFVALYKAKYKEHPGWAAANAFDTIHLTADAVNKGLRSADEMRDSLRSLKNYQGACGSYSASGDNRFTLPASLKRVTSKGFELLRQ